MKRFLFWGAVVAILFFAWAYVYLGTIHIGSLVSPAYAHDTGPGSWINRDEVRNPLTGNLCCGKDDCQPYAMANVTHGRGGYSVKLKMACPSDPDGCATSMLIPDDQAGLSEDQDIWVCRPPQGSIRCLLIPTGM